MVDPSQDEPLTGPSEESWSSPSDQPVPSPAGVSAQRTAPSGVGRTAWQEATALSISWEMVLWAGLTVLAFFTRFWNLGARVMSHDESLHGYYSWQLASGAGFTHNPMMHGPLLFELTAIFERFFGANDFAARLLPAIAGIFIVIGVPQLLRPWLGKRGALAAGVLLLISPFVLFYSRYDRHDIQVIAWLLVLVFAMFSYLSHREDRYLLLVAIALAFMITAMEISFIYMAIIAVFLVGRLLLAYPFSWKAIHEAAEFDLLVVIATLGAFFSSPIALLVLNPIFKLASGQPFVDVATVLSVQDASWITGPSGPRLLALLGVFSGLSVLIGVWWGGLRWLKLLGIFAVISIPLYTTFFTNMTGIFTGTIGSLGYWLSQQGVDRGSQPWYYYLIVFPIYEYLPILGALAAAVLYAFKRGRLSPTVRTFVGFVLLWAVSILISLTAAGEKMPWLSTHIAIPCILLAAWWIGELLAAVWPAPVPAGDPSTQSSPGTDLPALADKPRPSGASRWLPLAGLVGVAALILVTARTSYMVNYVNYDYTTEFIGYAHGAPGVKWALEAVQEVAAFTGQGKSMSVAYDDEIAWPMSWYLRDIPGFFGPTPSRQSLDAPVVIVGPNNWQKVDNWIGQDYHRYEVVRMWWPMEDYKNLTWQRIWYALTNPPMRSAVWQILWNRDYRAYAALTGENLNPPQEWPLQDRMRIYIRKDIAGQIPNLVLAPYQIADLNAPTDAYASVQKNIAPQKVLSGLALNAPRNLVFGPNGEIFVADSGNGRIVRLNPDGSLAQSWGSKTSDGQTPAAQGTFNEPWGMAVDASGNLYVADTWNHRIQKFDGNGKFLLQWGLPGLAGDGLDRFWGPRAIAISKDGKVYVTDTGNKRVVAFDENGKPLFEFDQQDQSAKLDEPVGLTVGPDGNVYVADTWNQRVAIFSADGHFQRSFPVQAWTNDGVDYKPYLAVDSFGRVYVTDPEFFRVLAFSAAGQPLASFGATGDTTLSLPNGLALASDGSIWVADAGNSSLVEYPPLK